MAPKIVGPHFNTNCPACFFDHFTGGGVFYLEDSVVRLVSFVLNILLESVRDLLWNVYNFRLSV
jgi:hypothetical protein